MRPGEAPEKMTFNPAKIMEEGLKGNLFTVDKNGFMRQITLTENENGNPRYEFNTSEPMTLPQNPPRPSFVTRMFAWLIPSFKAEVNEYKRQLAMNSAIRSFGEDPERKVNFNPTPEDRQADRDLREAQQKLQKEIQKEMEKQPVQSKPEIRQETTPEPESATKQKPTPEPEPATKKEPAPKPVETVSPPPVNETNNEPEKNQPQKTVKKVQPPAKMREFTKDPRIVKNDVIALTNDPEVLQNFKDAPENSDLEADTMNFLDHRIYRLTNMAEQAKTPAKSDRKPIITNEDGERKVMVDAAQPRSQRTGNGCWSVSLQTLLTYRGAKIDQEDIRSYRPDGTKQSIEFDLTAEKLNLNTVNSVSNYSTLINQFLPNVVLHSVGYNLYNRPGADEREDLLRGAISKGLEEHNSPVSYVKNDHFCTIVGMKGDKIYYKDPLTGRKDGRDPDTTLETSIQELASASKLQLFWLQDLEVDLGGNVKDMNGYAVDGVNYSGGVYSNIGEEVNSFNENFTIQEAGREFKVAGGEKSLRMSSNYPVTLGYKRNPAQMTGFAYNMDALGQMCQDLKKLSAEGQERRETGAVYTSLDALTKKLEGFVSGKVGIDYEQMYGVAKDYKALANAAGGDSALGRALGNHLQQVRSALDAHLHYDNRQLGYPKRWPEPGNPKREQLEQGLAGMIAAGNIKAVGMENENWLKGYDPKNVTTAKDQIRKGEAFQNMMKQLDLSVDQEQKRFGGRAQKRAALSWCLRRQSPVAAHGIRQRISCAKGAGAGRASTGKRVGGREARYGGRWRSEE